MTVKQDLLQAWIYAVMNKRVFLNQNRIKGITGCTLLAAGFALLLLSKIFHAFADWYSIHVYSVWVSALGRIMGWLPCSVSEILLYILAGGIVLAGARAGIRIARGGMWRKELGGYGATLLLTAGILFFLYVVNCGINYQRASFSESSGMNADSYTAEELEEVCLWLTEEVNLLSGRVERGEDGVMQISPGTTAAAVSAMQNLGEEYEELSGYYPKPKGLLGSWLLSVQHLSGIYLPFTIEANYNRDMVDYNIPFTMCHELSHLRGFMQEEEANFIAFLACYSSEEAEFRYSGRLLGWIYCMNVLYKTDYDAWEGIREKLYPQVEPDLKANREFWAGYDGAAAEVSNKINDTYLKANGQSEGVESYDRMVDLIVAYKTNIQ